ncbi:MAG: riboflavin biosynthesis protein RibF, partial [Kordiimonadaceae bacterium]|nr:riboflavin biosynthesis protein RibF [Kordiimonadaceae bacterium]
LLESHIFDFDHDIYEHLIKVEFVDFIRPEMKFDGLESLKAQIEKDCVTARELLALPQNQQSFISSPRLEEHL